MKGLHILILGIFLSLPLAGNAVVHFPSTDIIHYQTEKTKEKPRKKFRKWIKNHEGGIILVGSVIAGTLMIILGIVWKIRWLWLTGLFTIIAPWILGFIIVLFVLVFGFGYRKPPLKPGEPIPIPQEKKKSKKEKKKKQNRLHSK